MRRTEVPASVTELLTASGVRFGDLFGSGVTDPTATPTWRSFRADGWILWWSRGLRSISPSRWGVPRVDLVDLSGAPLGLLGRILRDRVVIHGHDEPARVEFEVRTGGPYLDFLPSSGHTATRSCGASRPTA